MKPNLFLTPLFMLTGFILLQAQKFTPEEFILMGEVNKTKLKLVNLSMSGPWGQTLDTYTNCAEPVIFSHHLTQLHGVTPVAHDAAKAYIGTLSSNGRQERPR